MADEKIFENEVMNEEELDNVAGGTRIETFQDGNELYKRGLLNEDQALSVAPVRELLHKMGYKYVDHGGIKEFGGKDNEYFNKAGESVSREEFWKNFNAENGTKIIR